MNICLYVDLLIGEWIVFVIVYVHMDDCYEQTNSEKL